MHVQIAAIPGGAVSQRRVSKRCGRVAAREEDVGFVIRGDGLADVGDADDESPLSWRQRIGQIRRRSVGCAQREMIFVAAAPAAKTLRVEEAKIERGVLILLRVMKCNCDGYDSVRYGEGSFNIRVVLLAGNRSLEDDVRFGLCRKS